ncbi:helix-turn-helix transcriptional regulator [Pseudomonas aeruginosa]|uniref:helix-turn-helix transcriptional regulator n=1 Tax=Pseudomonas aeruginosa TaxID=287 RepID=UPI001FCD1180|nr:AlpA family phage regulatory protein [Pseudomonas aeruginosa]
MRILRLRQVQERTGLSRSTIYDRININSPRYDQTFPRPVKIGLSAVGWLEESVNDWIRRRFDVADDDR